MACRAIQRERHLPLPVNQEDVPRLLIDVRWAELVGPPERHRGQSAPASIVEHIDYATMEDEDATGLAYDGEVQAARRDRDGGELVPVARAQEDHTAIVDIGAHDTPCLLVNHGGLHRRPPIRVE